VNGLKEVFFDFIVFANVFVFAKTARFLILSFYDYFNFSIFSFPSLFFQLKMPST